MDVLEYTRALRDTRMRVANEMQGFVEECQKRHPGEPFTAEEAEQFARYNQRIDDIEKQVADLDAADRREKESAVSREAMDRQLGEEGRKQKERNDADELRAFLRGEPREQDPGNWEKPFSNRSFSVNLARAAREKALIRKGHTAEEVRTLLWDTGSSASLVPTTLDRSLYEYLEASIAMFRMPTTKIQTAAGETMHFPRVNAHAIATQVIAQGTAIGGTDPTFARMTLDAYKYGQLVQIASEVVQDEIIDIVDFVTRDVGRAVGRLIDADLVAGSGSDEPNGVMTAITGSGTIATGGSLIDPTYEKLVDLVYSVNDEYRASGNTAWLMRDATAGVLRKLRDGAGGTTGAVLWEPSLTAGIQNGQPDRLLGFPVYTDPNVASLASDAKVMAFGDFSAYYIRQVGNFVFERSDDYAFNTDLVTFRGKWRQDGDVIDTTAINVMKRSV